MSLQNPSLFRYHATDHSSSPLPQVKSLSQFWNDRQVQQWWIYTKSKLNDSQTNIKICATTASNAQPKERVKSWQTFLSGAKPICPTLSSRECSAASSKRILPTKTLESFLVRNGTFSRSPVHAAGPGGSPVVALSVHRNERWRLGFKKPQKRQNRSKHSAEPVTLLTTQTMQIRSAEPGKQYKSLARQKMVPVGAWVLGKFLLFIQG